MAKVLYFMADWCQPCKRFLPEVWRVCGEGKVPLAVYDVNENSDAVAKHSIKSVPTLIIQTGDEVRFRANSVIPIQQLANELGKVRG